MEIGLESHIPTYAGGLGVLAGDYLKSAADMGVPMVGISLLYNKGYFRQHIVGDRQVESYRSFRAERYMEEMPHKVSLNISGEEVNIRAMRYIIKGENGQVPVFFLDTNNGMNSEGLCRLTECLYGGDHRYRIAQEAILGIGGVRMLEEMGYDIDVYHLNEGHGAFATIELEKNLQDAKDRTVFTTHTPVSAGHDHFSYDDVSDIARDLPDIRGRAGDEILNMTALAMNNSRIANGVSQLHAKVSQDLFPGYNIIGITNGVHSFTWTSPEMKALYDQYIPEWRNDPSRIEENSIPDDDLIDAHLAAKKRLIDYTNIANNTSFSMEPLTIGFARRFATYKRGDLILSNLERLADNGPVQVIFAGKAHPHDHEGKSIIERIVGVSEPDNVRVTFLENYSMHLGALLTQGSDIWLNNPRPPMEASGTSGMKAAHNGIPQISTEDGWWPEAKGGGWTIPNGSDDDNAQFLAQLIKNSALTYKDKHAWASLMRESIANASYFNTHRMLSDYMERMYR